MSLDMTRILVVDDEESGREVLCRTLNQRGYQCEAAPNPYDAEELLKREAFSLILLDIIMPGKSGIDYLPEVVAKYSSMAVVMMTALADTSIAVDAMREGAYDYITKPVDLSEFIFKVERALDRRAENLEIRQFQELVELLVVKHTKDLEQRKREISNLNSMLRKNNERGLSPQDAFSELQASTPYRSFTLSND